MYIKRKAGGQKQGGPRCRSLVVVVGPPCRWLMVVVVVVCAPHHHWLMVVVPFVGGCSWPFVVGVGWWVVVVFVQACRWCRALLIVCGWCCWALDVGHPCCHRSSVAVGFRSSLFAVRHCPSLCIIHQCCRRPASFCLAW